jgi:hypothetical protein
MTSPGRLWWQIRRDLKRGWDASYHDHKTLPRIEEWHWPFWGEEPAQVPIHVLTGEKDWRLSAWMLASFFHFTELSWPVVIHDDGTLSEAARATIEALFENCRVILRSQADVEMKNRLLPYPFCHEYRNSHPLGLKIFDMAHFTKSERYIVLDSDVLFFRRPQEILDWASGPNTGECWFNQDVQEASLVTGAEAREELDVKLWPRVNSGLCLLQRNVIDLDFCDRALAVTSILQGKVWRVEQTLFALCASRIGKGGLLSKLYEVSLKRRASPDAIARHYVGAVRDRFFGEGLKRLHAELLAAEERE